MRFLPFLFVFCSSAALAQTDDIEALAQSAQSLDSLYIMMSAAFVLGSFTTVTLIIALDTLKAKRAKK